VYTYPNFVFLFRLFRSCKAPAPDEFSDHTRCLLADNDDDYFFRGSRRSYRRRSRKYVFEITIFRSVLAFYSNPPQATNLFVSLRNKIDTSYPIWRIRNYELFCTFVVTHTTSIWKINHEHLIGVTPGIVYSFIAFFVVSNGIERIRMCYVETCKRVLL